MSWTSLFLFFIKNLQSHQFKWFKNLRRPQLWWKECIMSHPDLLQGESNEQSVTLPWARISLPSKLVSLTKKGKEEKEGEGGKKGRKKDILHFVRIPLYLSLFPPPLSPSLPLLPPLPPSNLMKSGGKIQIFSRFVSSHRFKEKFGVQTSISSFIHEHLYWCFSYHTLLGTKSFLSVKWEVWLDVG